MNVIKTIWMLVSGIDKKLSQVLSQLDALAKKVDSIFALLIKIQAELNPPFAVALVVKINGLTKGDSGMLQVGDTGSVVAALEVDDALGNPGAALDAAPVWSLSDPSLGVVNAAADGLSAVVVLSGKLGVFKLHVEALAGGAPLAADSEDVEVVVGAAALLKVSVAAVK